MSFYNLNKYNIYGLKDLSNDNEDYKIFFTNDEYNLYVWGMKVNNNIKNLLKIKNDNLFKKLLNLKESVQHFLGYYVYMGNYFLIFELNKVNLQNILNKHIEKNIKWNENFIINFYYTLMKISYFFYKNKINFNIKSLNDIFLDDNNNIKLINPIINNYYMNINIENNKEKNEYNYKNNLKNIKEIGLKLIFLKNNINEVNNNEYYKFKYSSNFFINIKIFNNSSENIKSYLNLIHSKEDENTFINNSKIVNNLKQESKIKIFEKKKQNKKNKTFLDIKVVNFNDQKLNQTEIKKEENNSLKSKILESYYDFKC